MRSHVAKRLIASMLLATAPIIASFAPASAYERVTISRTIKNTVTGTIHDVACRSDSFTIPPAKTGPVVNQFVTTIKSQVTMSAYRGGCLISRIEAYSAGINIMPFHSRGSTKSKFEVYSFSPNAHGMTGAIDAL